MGKSIEQLNVMFHHLQKSNYVTFDAVKKLKKIMGVYLIFTEENELLYIGNTNNFNVRFGTDLRHEKTHTLIKKMLKAKVHADRKSAREYFTYRYKYKIYVCENKIEAEALEHVAIWILEPKYNHNHLPVVI